jgi:hypothetical protein
MQKSVSPETESQLHELSKIIAEKHHLDAKSEKELYIDIEKKFNEYFMGEKNLTEEEAFILVREHFGNPEVIKTMLNDVYSSEAHLSLMRKIGAVLALTLFTGLARYCLNLIFRLVNLVIFGSAGMLLNWKEGFAFLCEGVLFLGILLHWRKQISNGEKPWFQTVRPPTFAGILIALLCIDTLVPFVVTLDPQHLLNMNPSILSEIKRFATVMETQYTNPYWLIEWLLKPSGPLTFSTFFFIFIALAYTIFQCAAWLWWCDTPPRNRNALLTTSGVWVLFSFFMTSLLPVPYFTLNSAGQLLNYGINWNRLVWNLNGLLLWYLIFIGCAYAIYIVLLYLSARRAKLID